MPLIRTVSYKEGEKVKCNKRKLIKNLGKIPFPYYDKFELNKYRASPKNFNLLTSRGCPFKCIYCSVSLLMGNKFRARSPNNVIKEIKYLNKRYGTTFFRIQDDNFTFNIQRAKKICKHIIDENLNIKWSLPNGIRIDKIDEELIRLIKDSNCAEIALGVESINDNILRNLKKEINRKLIEKAITLIKKYEIPIKAFFLIGSPEEKSKDIYDYLKFSIRWKLDKVRFNMLTPYPGTELYDWVKKKNYWTVETPLKEIIRYTRIGNGKTIYETPYFSKKEKERVYQDVWKKWRKYKPSRTFKGKIAQKLKKYSYIFSIISKLYRYRK